LQAAVLIPQLSKLQERNAVRRERVQQLLGQLTPLSALQPVKAPAPGNAASYFKLAWLYDAQHCGDWPRERLIAAVQAEGVALDAGFRGFVRRGSRCRRSGPLPHSTSASVQTVLLHHPVLLETERTIRLVADALRKVVSIAQSQQ
jgi:dTDP-4-amino-4,6-dideoxygalactose transaminase